MRQVWITRKGAPNVLQVREAPDPTPGPGEVRVRAVACGVNFADVMARMGLYPDAPPVPCVVGYEVAGTVDAVGAGVKSVKAGDRVLALCRFGGYSDMVVAPEVQVIPIPAKLTFEKAAAIPVNYITAWIMLVKLGNLAKGERVLIHAAAGGVGQAALQLAKWRGAEVFGTASASKHERLKSLGVAHCIDYHSQDFEEEVRRDEQVFLPRMREDGAVIADPLPQAGDHRPAVALRGCPSPQKLYELPFCDPHVTSSCATYWRPIAIAARRNHPPVGRKCP